MSSPGASAPGKAFLCGEYAVLYGAPAVVAAVNRRVRATWTDRGADPSEVPLEARATFDAVEGCFGRPPRHLDFDRGDLYDGPNKLGLGSSAAVAAASAAAVIALRDHDLRERAVRDSVFAAALRGHSAVAPQGSGADVAAATYGGHVFFQRRSGEALVQSMEPPSTLVCRLIWTGESSRTSDLLSQVSRLKATSPKALHRCMNALTRHAAEFAAAFRDDDAQGVIEAARKYNACMSVLGTEARAPIVNTKLRRVAEWAWWHGGAAKPCGAGGGDLAVAFFLDRDAADEFVVVCGNDGLREVEVEWGAEGVSALREGPPAEQATSGSTL